MFKLCPIIYHHMKDHSTESNAFSKSRNIKSFKSVRFPKLQKFDKIFCTNLQSVVWSCHNGVPPWDTNKAAGK